MRLKRLTHDVDKPVDKSGERIAEEEKPWALNQIAPIHAMPGPWRRGFSCPALAVNSWAIITTSHRTPRPVRPTRNVAVVPGRSAAGRETRAAAPGHRRKGGRREESAP